MSRENRREANGMDESKLKWGFAHWLAVVVLVMIIASLIFQQQQIDSAQTNAPRETPPRNTIYVNRQGQVVAADTTFQRCQRQCASICEPEYPEISSCLARQRECTYRCVDDVR